MTLFTTTAMMGQEIVTVCNGTDSNEHLPFRAELSKYDYRDQMIYPAADLEPMVEMEIKSMVFYIDPSAANGSLYGFQQGSWTVSMGETNATSISNYDNTTPLTQVFSGQFSFTNSTVTVTFTQPYRYHGGNLLFDINHKKTTVDGVKLYFLGTEMGYRTAYGASLPLVCSNFLPKTTFTAEIPIPCETPQDLSFQVSDPFNYTTQVSWTGGSGTFEMQYRKATQTTWTELGQTNNNQYTLENLEPDREYLFRVRSICDGEYGYWLNGSFSTPASGFLFPYSYDFDSPVPYAHWISSTYTVLDDNASYSHSGTHYLKFNNTVQLPTFAAPTNTLRLEFWACPEYNYNEAGNLAVGYLTDPSDASTFVTARIFNYTEWTGNLAYKKKHVDFENAPAGARIVFRQMNASTLVVRYWYIDDISVTTRPDCLEPLDLEVNNITEHSAELSWTARNGQTSWTLYYKKSTDSNYTAVNVQNLFHTLTGLDPNTNYEFYVTADCGSTESSEPSEVASFKTLCSELDLPYTYDFETDAPFDCWIPFSGMSIQHSASNSHSGTGYLFFKGTPSNLVALPQFAESLNTLRVVFWVQPEIWNAGTFSIGYMTDLDDADSYVPVETYTSQSVSYNAYEKKVVELSGVPQDAFIAFQQIPAYGYGWYLDDVTVETVPTCIEPIDLTATNITANTADLSWTTQDDENSWTVYYKNTAEENYHSVNVNTNPYTLTGLYSSTEYEYYVVAHCSNTEHSDPSELFTFITECGGTYSVPYSYDFEDPKPWECWGHTSGADLAADGWSNYCHSGRRCIVFNGDGSQFATLPLFQEATNTLRVEFWIQPLSYVQSGNGNFAVGTMTDPNDANTFTTIQSYAYNDWTENVCKKMVIDLDNVPADAYIAFKQYNCSYNYLWFLDDVSVSSIPSCREPQDLAADHFTDHSAQLSWTARNGETAWTVCYKKTTDTNYTEMAVTTNPYTLTGLDAGTEYEYYVISNCDSNNQSNPSTTFTFTTECDISVPYTCDFEDYSFLSCWHLITGVISDENSYFSHNGEGYLRFERSSGPESNFVALPQLQTPDNNLRLEFWTQPQSNTSSSGKLDVGYLTSLNDTSTFVAQASFTATDWAEASYNNNYERKVVELSGIPENAYIAFRHYNHSNNGCWFVDDVTVTPIPTCPEPTDFVVSDLTDHTAILNWVETGQATSWVVEYGTDPDFMDCISVPVSGTPMLELHDLTTYATYYARVYAKCSDTDHSYYATPLEFVATEKTLIFGPDSDYSYFFAPTTTNYKYSLTQQIYTVGELGEAGMIESIDFYMASGGDITRNLDIYLVSTDQTAFTSANDAIPATENDLVFSGSVSFTNAAWNTITFDRGFLYDGLHNVAIIVNDKTGSYSSPRYFRSSWNWGAIGLTRSDQSSPYDPSNPPQLEIYRQGKNHIRILKYPYGECMRPRLLNVSEVKFDRATLSWVEHGTSQAWMVHYEYTDDNQVQHEAEVEAGENPFTLTGLLPETTYTVKVRPVCTDETTAWCTSITFTTREECPVSTDLDVSNITVSTADLSWSGDPDVESYTVRYRISGMLEAPFLEGFEEEAAFLEWQFINLSSTINTDYVGRTTGSRRSGNYGFSFSSHDYSSQYDQYLVSPELTETGTLQFYYRCSSYMPEVFRVGYSTTTGDVEAFVWGEEQVASSTSWTTFTMELPANAKHFAIHYYTECHLQLYVDDITINAYEVAPGEWQTAVFEESNGVITGLDNGTQYEAQVKSTCSEEEWSNLVAFTTVPSEYAFEGSGTEEDPYLIASAEDWHHLSENLKNNYSYAGKHFLQTNDFSVVSVMLGLGSRFEGVYDGGGHTLTFHAGTAEMPQTRSYCAPFSKVGTATIKNLNIDGAIYSSSNNIGGLVGDVNGDLLITNCRNTMIISDTRNYTSNSIVCSHGGFVSCVQSGTTTISGCVFQGDLLGEYVIYCAGFIGYINTANNASATIAECFLDPVNVTWPTGCYGTIHNFARTGNDDHMTLTNDYYAKTLECEPQGQQVYKVTIDDPEHVSINYSEVTTSYDNSQLSIINNGLICEGVLYGINNKTYQLQIENIPPGFAVLVYANGVQLPISNSQCNLTINGEDVVITTEIIGVGEPIYEINSAEDWERLAYITFLGFHDYFGETVSLNADITVSTMVGTSNNPFRGTFEGNCHTLTFNMGSEEELFNESYCAPFRYVNHATIQNLKIEGSIYTAEVQAAGLVANADNLSVINCLNAISLYNYNNTSNNRHGGFVALAWNDVYFTGCAFRGKFLGQNDYKKCGGFVGLNYGNVTITDALFAPIETRQAQNSYSFVASSGQGAEFDFTNACFTNSFGIGQGYYCKTVHAEHPEMIAISLDDDATHYDCSGMEVIAGGIAQGGVFFGNQNTTFTLQLLPHEGYAISNVKANGVSVTHNVSGYVIPIVDEDVLITATMTLTGNPIFEINSEGEWRLFEITVNGGHTYQGETVNLNADIDVSTMAGSSMTNSFQGTFNGNGHTLNLDFNGSADCCAPFAFINNATIQNLHLTGSIATEGMRPASIAGFVAGNSTITNCWSEVAINSSHGSDIDAGAFAARVNEDQTLTLNGCRFTGSITYSHTSGYEGGGMVGWTQNNATAVLNDCLFEPSSISMSVYSGSYMFVSGKTRGILNNCFINEVAAASQLIAEGKVPYSITAEEGITMTNAGTATEYNVSGIISYGTGIMFEDVLYAGSGDQVILNLEREEEPGFSTTYIASAGTLSGTENPYTLTMPNEDVFITAETVVSDWEGSGTEEDPYVIYTWQQLDLLSVRVNGPQGQSTNTFDGKFFLIANDIEYPHNSEWNDLESEEDNYEAIGTGNMVCFKGTLDGDGHTISGLRINNASSYQGLFGYLSGTVKNITIANTRIMGRDFDGCGAIAGYNENGIVINCHVTSTVALRWHCRSKLQ